MSCRNCGECCRAPGFVVKHEEEKALFWCMFGYDVHANVDGTMLVRDFGRMCCNYDASSERHCRIYADRPLICRAFLCREATE